MAAENHRGVRLQAAALAVLAACGAVVPGARAFARHRHLRELRELNKRISTSEANFKELAERYPAIVIYRTYGALLFAELGRDDEARDELLHLASGLYPQLAADLMPLVSRYLLIDVCRTTPLIRHIKLLFRLLLPLAEHETLLGPPPAAQAGATSHELALLAARLDHPDDAERYFEDAIARNSRIGAHVYAAQIQLDYAEFLRGGGAPDGRPRARELVQRVLETAKAFPSPELAGAAEALLTSVDATT